MLGTNPETVRRWIRDGKLGAAQSSRKDGNVIDEKDLNSFLLNAPKYMAKASTSALKTVVPIATAAAFFPFALIPIIASMKKNKAPEEISYREMKQCALDEIARDEESITEKQQLIEKTQAEIDELQLQIDSLKAALENLPAEDEEDASETAEVLEVTEVIDAPAPETDN